MFVENVPYPTAFVVGLLSFFTPCVLPLIPAYFTFITGFSLEELIEGDNDKVRKKLFFSTLSYVLGFSVVFILMGASASFLGGLVHQYRDSIRIFGGIIIILFGIHLTGMFQFRFLYYDKHIHLTKKPLHLFGIFLVGMAFGAGWSPCIGPLLGSILIVASSQETVWRGIVLLSIYSLGLALPFLVISIFINFILEFFMRVSHMLKYVNRVAGILLIVLGVVLLTNKLLLLSA